MEEASKKKPIYSFRDLEVYQDSYQTMLEIGRNILPKLLENEKYDLKDQLSRSSKAIPRLIAEGFANKHQRLGFHKYLDDALSEINETIVSLEQTKDLYNIEADLCAKLIVRYEVCGKRVYKLREAWNTFVDRIRKN